MTVYFSFIGDADDPNFFWDPIPDEKYRIGNLPRRILPEDKLDSLGVNLFWLKRLADNGAPNIKEIDWGAVGARMTGAEMHAFLGDREDLRDPLARLEATKLYVLVAGEH